MRQKSRVEEGRSFLEDRHARRTVEAVYLRDAAGFLADAGPAGTADDQWGQRGGSSARPRGDRQKDLLRPALEEIIDLGHPLVRLAREIDWGFLDRRFAMGRPPSLTPALQKEDTRRRAQCPTLQELAGGYDLSISTMRRATRAA